MTSQAYLECFTGSRVSPKRFYLEEFPARIGRQPDCAVQLNVARISRVHAEIQRDDNGFLQLVDLDSTNGTFVNGRRIETSTVLVSGDVLHVGDQELRLIEEEPVASQPSDAMTQIGLGTLPHQFPTQVREFNELLDNGVVRGGQTVADCLENLQRTHRPQLVLAPDQLLVDSPSTYSMTKYG